MSAFTPAGSGGIIPSVSISGATNPLVANVPMSTANTEYSYALPTNCKQFLIKLRGQATMQVSYTAGGSSSLYMTVPRCCSYMESDLSFGATTTIYFQSNEPSQTAEIVVWT